MLVTSRRPRNLGWHHAAALLFGDWGTSRLYVLGLAFFYTAHATPVYLGLMSVLMAGVAWAYTIICRNFPDGGGVYASARMVSPALSAVGATLLLCDYVVTASLSALDGMHYFGAPGEWALWGAISVLVLCAGVNWLGARSAGRAALGIAVAAVLCSLVIGLLALRFVPAGLRATTLPHAGSGWANWESFVRIVLALSGVEAIANMTGVMREPVRRTSRRAIWLVLVEVVALNLVFGVALSGLPRLREVETPHHVVYDAGPSVVGGAPAHVPEEVLEYRDTAVKVIAEESVGGVFGAGWGNVAGGIVGVVFGLLLLSAANTAIMGMVGVQYAMAQDGELPAAAKRLNYSGVPWVPLVVAGAAPVCVLLVTHDVAALADLYAVGVCGAITINVLCAAVNRSLEMSRRERSGVWVVGVVMLLIEATILATKPSAALFAGGAVGAVLTTRGVVRMRRARGGAVGLEPAHGWLSELTREMPAIPMDRARVLLAARGRHQSEFAVDLARRRGATLFAMYVRTLRVMDVAPGQAPDVSQDRSALEALGCTAMLAREAGVTCLPIYVCSADISGEILDFATTYGCDTVIMGKTRRSVFSRAVEGDVVTRVAQHLPDGVALITREATPHPIAGRRGGLRSVGRFAMR